MFCTACGSEVPREGRICPACSTPVAGPGPVPATAPPGPGTVPATAPPAVLPSGNEALRLEEVRALGWNWGGFFLPYLWLVGHGRLSAGMMLMFLGAIPFVWLLQLVIYPAVAIYLGLNGYELAWKSQPYHSVEQLRGKEREWSLWGGICIALVLFMMILGLMYFSVFMEELRQGFEGVGLWEQP